MKDGSTANLLATRACQECSRVFQPNRSNEIRCTDCRQLIRMRDRMIYTYHVPAAEVATFAAACFQYVYRKSSARAAARSGEGEGVTNEQHQQTV